MSAVTQPETKQPLSFYDQPGVEVMRYPVGDGVPMAIKTVSHPEIGLGGAYGSWGIGYDNESLQEYIGRRLGRTLSDEDRLNLSPLGFVYRYHSPDLPMEEHIELEVAYGSALLKRAARASGWEPQEVEAVLIGMSAPVCDDYVERISDAAGIPQGALKVSVHKACDGSMGALNLALNDELGAESKADRNLAEELVGKKVLVGGIEGLSCFLHQSSDVQALQLFGNGAGVIGIIPGQSMQFLVGKAHEVYDEQGVLAVKMYYPHSGLRKDGRSMIEVSQLDTNHLRFAGLMHEPEGGAPVDMAGPMGMVKLFVRNGVEVVRDVYLQYQKRMEELGELQRSIRVTIAHHANYKINSLKSAQLEKGGIRLSMPWLLSEFGNVSAASNMIAFLRQLPDLRPGDHILFDGFGAGTYYDVLAVALGKGG